MGKLLIAGSIAAFGDNGIGWRIPSVVAGLVALLALFFAIRAAGGGEWLALLAVFLASLDNLTMVHGRIGVLDMMALAPPSSPPGWRSGGSGCSRPCSCRSGCW